MSNLETYREKALECARAANGVQDSGERIGLLGLASVYTALADYVDHQHEHGAGNWGDQDQDMHKDGPAR